MEFLYSIILSLFNQANVRAPISFGYANRNDYTDPVQMLAMVPLTLFGPIDTYLGPVIEYVIFILVLINLATRHVAHKSHVRQAEQGGAEAISRHPAHTASTLLLILSSYYFLTLEVHAGAVLSVLVVGMFISDFFGIEARQIEARRDMKLERPKAAIAASILVFLYSFYQSLFFLLAPIWNVII